MTGRGRGRPACLTGYWGPAALAGILVLAVAILYGPAVGFGFANYDENHQLIDNPRAHSISPGNIFAIFTGFQRSYYPVRLLSFAIEHAVWGLNPAGYHLTNVVLHAANTLLVFWLAFRLARQRSSEQDPASPDRDAGMVAFLAGGLFAVHPVVVEPAVWIGAREELLMVFFAMSCAHLHLSAVAAEVQGRRRPMLHTWAGFCCLLACMSNAVAAIIPALITAYDCVAGPKRTARDVIRGTWFLWIIGAAAAAMKVITGRVAAAGLGLEVTRDRVALDLSVAERIRTILHVYALNLKALFWPDELTLRYPSIVPAGFLEPGVLVGLACIVTTLVLLWLVRKRRLLLFGLLWFLLALAPSSQVVPHHMYRADRFFYLPMVGLCVAVAAALTLWSSRYSRARRGILALGCVVLVALAVRSAAQVRVWGDPVALWENCARLNPMNDAVFTNLGDAYGRRGDYDRAMAAHEHAMELNPQNPEPHYNRGLALAYKGEYRRAIEDFDRSLELRLNTPSWAHNNRGLSYYLLGENDKALTDLNRAIELQGNYADAYNNRGLVRGVLGQEELALADFDRAIALNPRYANAYYNRGCLHARWSRYDQGISDLLTAMRLGPMPPEVHVWLGYCLVQKGRLAEARDQYAKARLSDGKLAAFHEDWGRRFARQGKLAAAIRHFREALRLRPDAPSTANHLAWILATGPDRADRNGEYAVWWAEKACKLTAHREPEMLDTLAAAYAEQGQFEEAVKVAGEALTLAGSQGKTSLQEEIKARLMLYAASRPYRTPPATSAGS